VDQLPLSASNSRPARQGAPDGRMNRRRYWTIAQVTEAAGPEEVLVDVRGPMATVTINRPAKHNAVTTGMWTRIADVIPELAATPGVFICRDCARSAAARRVRRR